jgi:hypothetical protein
MQASEMREALRLFLDAGVRRRFLTILSGVVGTTDIVNATELYMMLVISTLSLFSHFRVCVLTLNLFLLLIHLCKLRHVDGT